MKSHATDVVDQVDQAEEAKTIKTAETATASSSSPAPAPPYTAYSPVQLRVLCVLLGFAAITSPLTATIYFPLLPLLRVRFAASAQAINLSLTVYIVFQALSPLLFAPLSDARGRRPVLLGTLLLYAAANVGLAVLMTAASAAASYAALLVLRALQSLGASAAYAVACGVVADVVPPRDRGAMLGPLGMALNLGACVGPVVGGAVAYASGTANSSGSQWVFWSLVFVAAALLVTVALGVPETARRLVGNGGDPACFRWWQRCCLRGRPTPTDVPLARSPFTLALALAPLRIVLCCHTAPALWLHASFYLVDYVLVAAVPDIYGDRYGFNELQIGLAYLPRGLGIIVGSYLTGRLMDWNYRVVVGRASGSGNGNGNDSPNSTQSIPLEKARSRGALPLLLVTTASTASYGWAVEHNAPVAVPLLLQFIQGLWSTSFYTTYAALLVDVCPRRPASAAAAASITRCALAAAGVAALQPLLDVLGRSWTFTLLGLASGAAGVLAVVLLRTKAMAWRLQSQLSDLL